MRFNLLILLTKRFYKLLCPAARWGARRSPHLCKFHRKDPSPPWWRLLQLIRGPSCVPMIPYTLSGLRIDLALDKTIDTSRSVALFTIRPQLDSTKRRNQPSNETRSDSVSRGGLLSSSTTAEKKRCRKRKPSGSLSGPRLATLAWANSFLDVQPLQKDTQPDGMTFPLLA
jgi:hypothetical protein